MICVYVNSLALSDSRPYFNHKNSVIRYDPHSFQVTHLEPLYRKNKRLLTENLTITVQYVVQCNLVYLPILF